MIFQAKVMTKDTRFILRAQVKDNNIPDNFQRSFSSAFKSKFWIFRNDISVCTIYVRTTKSLTSRIQICIKKSFIFGSVYMNILNKIRHWYLVALSLFYCSSCAFIAFMLHVISLLAVSFFMFLCAFVCILMKITFLSKPTTRYDAGNIRRRYFCIDPSPDSTVAVVAVG